MQPSLSSAAAQPDDAPQHVATTLTALARDDIPQLVRAIHECVKSIREIGVLLESL